MAEIKDDSGIVRHKILHFSPFVDRGELLYRVTPGIQRIDGEGKITDIMNETLGRAFNGETEYLIVNFKDDGRIHLEKIPKEMMPLAVRRLFK